VYATTVIESPSDYYPDVRVELAEIDTRLDTLRNLYTWADKEGREEMLTQARELQEQRVRKQFRLNREEDYFYPEADSVARIDKGYEDRNLQALSNELAAQFDGNGKRPLPTTDAEWTSWKVNKFIENIAFRNNKGDLYLRAGKYSVRLYNVESAGDNAGYFSFQCYAPGCKFRARHSVVNGAGVADSKRIELRLAWILAHTYKH